VEARARGEGTVLLSKERGGGEEPSRKANQLRWLKIIVKPSKRGVGGGWTQFGKKEGSNPFSTGSTISTAIVTNGRGRAGADVTGERSGFKNAFHLPMNSRDI